MSRVHEIMLRHMNACPGCAICGDARIIVSLESEAARLRKALEEAERDARRYRFWREFYRTPFTLMLGDGPARFTFKPSKAAIPLLKDEPAAIDAAIDAALSQEPRT